MDRRKKERSRVDYDHGHLDALMDYTIQPSSASWRCLFNFTSKSHTVPITVAILLSVVSGIIIPALAILLGGLFEAFTSYGGKQIHGPDLVKQTSVYGQCLVALGCTSGVLNAIYFMCWLTFGELQAGSARGKTFDGILDKNMEWFDTQSAGVVTLTSQLQM